jgi:hypothetical protein
LESHYFTCTVQPNITKLKNRQNIIKNILKMDKTILKSFKEKAITKEKKLTFRRV